VIRFVIHLVSSLFSLNFVHLSFTKYENVDTPIHYCICWLQIIYNFSIPVVFPPFQYALTSMGFLIASNQCFYRQNQPTGSLYRFHRHGTSSKWSQKLIHYPLPVPKMVVVVLFFFVCADSLKLQCW
jgi:hypothetical protein